MYTCVSIYHGPWPEAWARVREKKSETITTGKTDVWARCWKQAANTCVSSCQSAIKRDIRVSYNVYHYTHCADTRVFCGHNAGTSMLWWLWHARCPRETSQHYNRPHTRYRILVFIIFSKCFSVGNYNYFGTTDCNYYCCGHYNHVIYAAMLLFVIIVAIIIMIMITYTQKAFLINVNLDICTMWHCFLTEMYRCITAVIVIITALGRMKTEVTFYQNHTTTYIYTFIRVL